MISTSLAAKSSFYVKPSEDQKTVEVFDSFELTNEFKHEVCVPYFNDIYKVYF